ncbi:hypothetical protein [Serratia aquatilis]|uniref:Uncharacterized protein n=1 Tax=Serratia aquatilis TaxID=1737515 RepID=A0ABV6ECF7_9GAMM
MMKLPTNLATYATGLKQVLTALRAKPPVCGINPEDFKWQTSYAIQQDSNNLISLKELGYSLNDYQDSLMSHHYPEDNDCQNKKIAKWHVTGDDGAPATLKNWFFFEPLKKGAMLHVLLSFVLLFHGKI